MRGNKLLIGLLLLGLAGFLLFNGLFLIIKPTVKMINYNGIARDGYGSVTQWWSTKHMCSSNTIKIGDYKIVFSKFDSEPGSDGWVQHHCIESAKIYKQGVFVGQVDKVHSFKSWSDNVLTLNLFDGGSQYDYGSYTCYYVANSINYNPHGIINITPVSSSIKLVKGDSANISLLVSNEEDYALNLSVVSKVCALAPLGEQCKNFDNSLLLNPHEVRTIVFDFPIEQSANVSVHSIITPKISLKDLGVSGFDYTCVPGSGSLHCVSWCLSNGYDWYSVGQEVFDKNVSVVYVPTKPESVPKPSKGFFVSLFNSFIDWLNKIFG